jgi:outer membrane lipoprotein-sorting protein
MKTRVGRASPRPTLIRRKAWPCSESVGLLGRGRWWRVGLVLQALLAGEAGAQTNDVAAFLQRLGQTTAKVEFTQERHLALFEEPLQTEGHLCFQKPNSIRWEVTKPYRSILVATGAGAAQFEQTDGKWKRLDLSYLKSIPNFVGGMALFLEGRYLERQQDYEFALKGTVLVLKPKQKTVIEAFELEFGDDLAAGARAITMRQPDGDWTRIAFRNQAANQPLPAGTFDLQTPVDIATIQKAVTGAR